MTREDELAVSLSRGRDELAAGRAEEAADLFEEALFEARQLEDDVAELEATGMLVQAYLRLELRDEAARVAGEALQMARVRRDEEAVKQLERLQMIARSSPAELEMNTSFGDGRAALVDNEHERAAEHLERALELAREVGHPVAEGASMQLLAQAYLGLGRAEEALGLAEQAERAAEALGDQAAVEHARELKARAAEPEEQPLLTGIAAELQWGHEALAEGDLERGLRHLERAREQAADQGEAVPEASACGLLAQAYLELDRFEDAAIAARRALELAEELDHVEAARDFRRLLVMTEAGPQSHALARDVQRAIADLEAGEIDGAIVKLETVATDARALEQDGAWTMIAGLLSRAYQQVGRGEDATSLAQEALSRVEAQGDEKTAAYFRGLLAELEGGPAS